MAPWQRLRDLLRTEPLHFRHVDAAQLVKHALGLASEARRCDKRPVLVYLHAEPVGVAPAMIARPRAEAATLASLVEGAYVPLHVSRWRDWLESWVGEAADHARAVQARYRP